MKCFVALFALVAVAMAATTHKPHNHHTHDPNHTRDPNHTPDPDHTREPIEKESFSFYYSSTTNHLIIHNGKDCYVATLTADEQMNIHTDTGLRSVELRLLNQITQATSVAKDTLTASDVKHCGHKVVNVFTIN